MMRAIKILGIESSCDDTSAAIVDSDNNILSNVLLSSIEQNSLYKGIVPEIAARAHLDYIKHVIDVALNDAKLTLEELDAIAVTSGPGLIGGVIVGTMTAKAIAASLHKPLIAINHLEGHALTVRLTNKTQYPYLLLLASGGHCQFIAVMGLGVYKMLGETLDDSAGEAFDKTAKLLNLEYPGGPIIEKLAQNGNNIYSLPVVMAKKEGCDLSFSGLKTAVRLLIQSQGAIDDQKTADICASFQHAVGQTLKVRSQNAIKTFKLLLASEGINFQNASFVFAGGVAANQYLRAILVELANSNGMPFVAPPVNLCTDNAAMIAWVGVERFQMGLFSELTICPRARWSLADSKPQVITKC
jgi:N6-L-threonylcarbamoyladenine synthase